MATQKFAAQEIKGYTPSNEPTVTDTIWLLNGRNYMFDSRGPISMYGNRVLCPAEFGRPEYIQGKRLHFKDGDVTLTIAVDGIYRWREDIGGWQLLYVTEDTSTGPYRWTSRVPRAVHIPMPSDDRHPGIRSGSDCDPADF